MLYNAFAKIDNPAFFEKYEENVFATFITIQSGIKNNLFFVICGDTGINV